jgi:hypothetical protein
MTAPKRKTPEEQLLARLAPLLDSQVRHFDQVREEDRHAIKDMVAAMKEGNDIVAADTFMGRLYPGGHDQGPLSSLDQMNALQRADDVYGHYLLVPQMVMQDHNEGRISAREALRRIADNCTRHPAEIALSSLAELQEKVHNATPAQAQGKEDVKAAIEAGLQASIDGFGPFKKVMDEIAAHVNRPRGPGGKPVGGR